MELKILSFNAQVGIPSKGPVHYLFNTWRHFLPHKSQIENLDLIAQLIKDYDIVGMQELDSGSFRSGGIDQISYLAKRCEFEFKFQQINRNLGKYAQHAKGLLSKKPLVDFKLYKLPSVIPGRGAMTGVLETDTGPILIINIHLSLMKKAQAMQMQFLTDLVNRHDRVIMTGDFNLTPNRLLASPLIKNTNLKIANLDTLTYPSWKPKKLIDYILVSDNIEVLEHHTIKSLLSDHLPVAVKIQV